MDYQKLYEDLLRDYAAVLKSYAALIDRQKPFLAPYRPYVQPYMPSWTGDGTLAQPFNPPYTITCKDAAAAPAMTVGAWQGTSTNH